MALEITAQVEIAFQGADKADQRLDEFVVRDILVRILKDLGKFTKPQLKGNFALVSALEFQPRRGNGEPVWDMHWQPLGGATDSTGTVHRYPDIDVVDAEIIEEWSARARATRHPLLRARYADLAWEVAKFRRKELALKPEVDMARRAIDGYLDGIGKSLFKDDFYAWTYVGRAVELATSINDQERLQRAKASLFNYQVVSESRDRKYPFWRFHQIAWDHANELGLADADRKVVVDALESQLNLRSRIEDPEHFDPHISTAAADALRLWREFAGQKVEADRAAHTAGLAFEAAAAQAKGLTAVSWLSDQLARYRQLGDLDGVARMEREIRARSEEVQGEMKRISVPLDVKPEELEAWADRVAGESLEEGLAGFARVGLVHRDSTERAVLENSDSPIFNNIPIAVTGPDGHTDAMIGSVESDLDGRVVHYATQLLSNRGPWLNLAWTRIKAKHGADLEGVLAWLAGSPCFPPERLPFVREGLSAWLAGDFVKAVHVLVPQVESALRDFLTVIGGVVTKPNRYGGSQRISFGEVLEDEKFAQVPEAIRFHFQVLYNDPRGLNARNKLAHGLLPFGVLGIGLANLVVHSIILIGTFRPKSV